MEKETLILGRFKNRGELARLAKSLTPKKGLYASAICGLVYRTTISPSRVDTLGKRILDLPDLGFVDVNRTIAAPPSLAMANDQGVPSEARADTDASAKQPDKAGEARRSMESRATTLPSYREQSDQPPSYGAAKAQSGEPSTSEKQKPRAQPTSSAGVSAAAISAVMATSSSENDKMHSKRPKKVDDWNKDSTYKGKLARMTGSTSKWNYFGADVGENPFKRFGRKK